MSFDTQTPASIVDVMDAIVADFTRAEVSQPIPTRESVAMKWHGGNGPQPETIIQLGGRFDGRAPSRT